MSETKTVRVVGYIKTNKVGSECDFEFSEEVDSDLSGEALEAYLEESARDAAFQMMEWEFEVKVTEE